MSDFWSSLLSGFVGGGLISLITTHWSNKHKDRSDQRVEDKVTLHTLISLRSELNALYNRYHSQAGNVLENTPAQDAPAIYFPVEEDYFPIYRNNTFIIGKINREQTVENVVNCYILASALFDSIRYNNGLCQKFSDLESELRRCDTNGRSDKISNDISMARNAIVSYWSELQKLHYELKRIASLAYTGLTEEIDQRRKCLGR